MNIVSIVQDSFGRTNRKRSACGAGPARSLQIFYGSIQHGRLRLRANKTIEPGSRPGLFFRKPNVQELRDLIEH